MHVCLKDNYKPNDAKFPFVMSRLNDRFPTIPKCLLVPCLDLSPLPQIYHLVCLSPTPGGRGPSIAGIQFYYRNDPKFLGQTGKSKQCRPRSDYSSRVYTVCHSIGIVWTHYSMKNHTGQILGSLQYFFWVSEFLGVLR